jgi:hypothetical protein
MLSQNESLSGSLVLRGRYNVYLKRELIRYVLAYRQYLKRFLPWDVKRRW